MTAATIFSARIVSALVDAGIAKLTFDPQVPTRTGVGNRHARFSSISTNGEVTLRNGKTYLFDACRMFDRTAPRGERVSWGVDLRPWDGRKTGNRLPEKAMAAVKIAIQGAFNAVILADNVRISEGHPEPKGGVTWTAAAAQAAEVLESELEGLEVIAENVFTRTIAVIRLRSAILDQVVAFMGETPRWVFERLQAGEKVTNGLGVRFELVPPVPQAPSVSLEPLAGREVLREGSALWTMSYGTSRDPVSLELVQDISQHALADLSPSQVVQRLAAGLVIHTAAFRYRLAA